MDKASRLADRLSLFDEAAFMGGKSRLSGENYFSLAVFSAGQNKLDDAINYLELRIDSGLLADWRRDIMLSHFSILLKDEPRYIALVERVETEMVQQLAKVNAREAGE